MAARQRANGKTSREPTPALNLKLDKRPKGGPIDKIVVTADDLLACLEEAKCVSPSLVVHLFWLGCRLGCNPDAELPPALRDVQRDIGFSLLEIPWREGTKDDESGAHFYDYRRPQTEAYLLFREMVQCKVQQCGGFETVETYSAPPWDRPHFPQLFVIDTREIDSEVLGELRRAVAGFDDADDLGKVHRKLMSDGANHGYGEVILTLERLRPGADPNLPESYVVDDWIRRRLRRVIAAKGLRLQLLNEHIYRINDQQLERDALEASFACAIQGQGPRYCFAFQRGPIAKGCGVSRGTTQLN